MVETFSLAAQDGTVRDAFDEFSAEGTALLEEGIRAVMAEEMDRLTLPPDRMAVLIRTMLSGLVVELARARTEEERAQVQLAYEDLRFLFSSFAVGGQP